MQKPIIIADASCLILLSKINELQILQQLFQSVTITSQIAIEFGNQLPGWFLIKEPNIHLYQSLRKQLDAGEASAIALATQFEDSLLIIDDRKGRKFATALGLNITGTIGIILQAKLAGIIPAVKPLLNKIKATNFRITSELELLILNKAKED